MAGRGLAGKGLGLMKKREYESDNEEEDNCKVCTDCNLTSCVSECAPFKSYIETLESRLNQGNICTCGKEDCPLDDIIAKNIFYEGACNLADCESECDSWKSYVESVKRTHWINQEKNVKRIKLTEQIKSLKKAKQMKMRRMKCANFNERRRKIKAEQNKRYRLRRIEKKFEIEIKNKMSILSICN